LGIPTVMDRLIQQALLQVLEPLYDPSFSLSSYGFRPGRSAYQALKAAREHVASGKGWVVDLDLEKFFDRVNHDVLMNRLARRIGDKRALKLMRRYLQAGVMLNGVVVEWFEGAPQGGPLSPLLANILLDEFDRELGRRGHAFCRYADDCNAYVRSQRAGERVMASLTRFLQERLKLRVNREESAVARTHERKFLGMRIVGVEKARICLAPQSLLRLKATIRRTTKRNRGVNLRRVIAELNQLTIGWVDYFAPAEVKSICRGLDSWIRRWWDWQDDSSHGRVTGAPGQVELRGVLEGCVGRTPMVQPGRTYAVRLCVKTEGRGLASLGIGWKTPEGKWTAPTENRRFVGSGQADATGWREIVGLVQVPPGAGQLVFMASASGQLSAADGCWFRDAALVEVAE